MWAWCRKSKEMILSFLICQNIKKTLCVILSYCMVLCGCAENYHLSDHCDEFTENRIKQEKKRKDTMAIIMVPAYDLETGKHYQIEQTFEDEYYNPYITPVTDVATECYCYTEDAAVGAGIGVVVGAVIVGSSFGPGWHYP